MCGENPPKVFVTNTFPGSSPRVRGKRQWPFKVGGWLGLIPACAGKTWVLGSAKARSKAHPRVCGENYKHFVLATNAQGSSPRVRGKRIVLRVVVSGRGLIPACAGKTPKTYATPFRISAHPRVCGENTVIGRQPGGLSGSSPRVRGKPIGFLAQLPNRGLIPACAGKTQCV